MAHKPLQMLKILAYVAHKPEKFLLAVKPFQHFFIMWHISQKVE